MKSRLGILSSVDFKFIIVLFIKEELLFSFKLSFLDRYVCPVDIMVFFVMRDFFDPSNLILYFKFKID